jgi:8-oxo-dGTP pyrophosphatase MutT (NUDIX family)
MTQAIKLPTKKIEGRSKLLVEPVDAGGGVLYRQKGGKVCVLLIYRRNVWDLPKGKREEGEEIDQCAIREVSEEVGCPPPENQGKLIETYHEYEENGKKIGKTTHWFAMQTRSEVTFHPEESEGIEEVRWVELRKARERVGFENLVLVLDAFEKWLGSPK